MKKETNDLMGIIITLLIVICVLLVANFWIGISTEHYRVARYEVERIAGHRIYFDGGDIFVNNFFYPIENDFKNLSKGDDILIHYVESILDGKTYIQIEKL